MKTVCLVDTGVFVEWLKVPKKSDPSRGKEIMTLLRARLKAGWELLVPVTVILETGNHIGQCSTSGSERRQVAQRFCDEVQRALDGAAPWVATNPLSTEDLNRALGGFVEHATKSDPSGKGSGIGDLTIIQEWERQCELNPTKRVLIWSLDVQLAGYDTHPE